ncbi:acyltransferase [Ochrobactrum sp. Marseille-Q0166]|uniref:acyltransferase family protein n=1 Tax=Ochrobactrum sp. Marseille-Q0166 TaxID=2761105 RepID=UPI0016564BEC|nr:acyltransferase [Ochrobactrum sp. Marseille-Q0166]MBC8719861.1 acyltransferase [Ochrobactrum sp. Marseille-Q0166]
MINSSNNHSNKIFEIECLRGFAALYVVLFHVIRPELQEYSYIISIPFRFGQEAVILFFLLSGFCINYSWSFKSEQNVKIFAKDRFIRLVPIYIIALLISYVCASLYAGYFIDVDSPTLVGNMLFLQDRIRQGTIVPPYMGNEALWSLSYEVAFYIFYYLVNTYINERYRTFVVSITTSIFFLIMLVYPNQISRFVSYFCIWWLGAVMSELYLGRVMFKEIIFAILPILFISSCLLILAYQSPTAIDIGNSNIFPYLELRHFVSAIFIALFLIGWAATGWPFFKQLFGPFVVIAPISYALYVLHFPIMVGARSALDMQSWLSILITATVTLLLSMLLEGPFQKFVNRKFKGQ